MVLHKVYTCYKVYIVSIPDFYYYKVYIVSIPDLCTLTYLYMLLHVESLDTMMLHA